MKIFLMTFLYTGLVWAQSSTFKLEGSYRISSSHTDPVKFSINWKEDEKGQVKGEYRDSYFTKSAIVTGFTTEAGRNLTVLLPTSSKGVKSITLLSSKGEITDLSTTIPVSIITRNLSGSPLTTVSTKAQFSNGQQVAQRQEEECAEGMGNLEGFCGVYSGMVSEDSDTNKKCDLIGSDQVFLELTGDGALALLLGPNSEIVVPPRHEIGRLPVNPDSTSVDVLSRHCRALERISFPSEDCKRVHLTGSFIIERDRKHFKGSYTITDEKNNQSCRYGLSMDIAN